MGIHSAKWICEKSHSEAPIFRKHFTANKPVGAVIDICGLGMFELYINGKRVSDFVHMPAQSTYEQITGKKLGYPIDDIFEKTRFYYCRFDVTEYLCGGENLLSVHLGNGFYNQTKMTWEVDCGVRRLRLAFSLTLTYSDGSTCEIQSDESVLSGKSYITENNMYYGEVHDLSEYTDIHSPSFDDSAFEVSELTDAPDGELTLYDYPYDRVVRKIVPKFLDVYDGKYVYDIGENISGRLAFDTSYDGRITVAFSEELNHDMTLNTDSIMIPEVFTAIGDGKPHKDVKPLFSWVSGRYFTVEGEIENPVYEVIYTDLETVSDFVCENETVNRLLDAYRRTQLSNTHGCVPSDCPHRERRGYTGDGQITCETVMHVFGAKRMYDKWLRDIADCRNVKNGHIQHTAPFSGGGGGPGGWGGAIVVVPYMYYKMYGDPSAVRNYLYAIKHYLEYMESHCEGMLVTHEEKGGWCLGDWCFKGCCTEKDVFPLTSEYVNTCYLAKFYDMMLELDERLSLGLDRKEYLRLAKSHKKAIKDRYFDDNTGDFCGNFCGANAFAVDIGIGDERTFENLCRKYDALGGFDTGIFATEILVRILGERGRSDLVFKLLSSRMQNASFGGMLDRGATTIWERWDTKASHNHPMFGGCIKALWTSFLGITPLEPGYGKVKIAPCDIPGLGSFGGHLTTLHGKIAVNLERVCGNIRITVDVPDGVEAHFSFADTECPLAHGKTTFVF